MSRVGKKPIELPSGVKVNLSGRKVQVEGPKGKLDWEHHPDVKVAVEGNQVTVERSGDHKTARALHGTTRQLIHNMVFGVSQGYERKLEIVGVGYNAKADKKKVTLSIGFCHPVEMNIPQGLEVECPKPVNITIRGTDKQKVGQFAAEIRRIRPPEPYKGKGIRYENEIVRRKAAKSFGAG